MPESPLRIVIVGAGFTAHAAAISILHNVRSPLRLTLSDPKSDCGGLAYGQADSTHVLNVRASQFSAIENDPLDFVKWARCSINGLKDAAGVEDAYLPRRHVQSYIRQRLAAAVAARPDAQVLRIQSRVARISRSGSIYEVQLATGKLVESDIAILASGYGADRRLSFGLDPFGDMSPRRASQSKRIAFVGSGLTFIDGYLRVRALGFKGEAVSISRSARLPAAHADSHVVPTPLNLPAGMSLLEIFRAARKHVRTQRPDDDWRSVVNGLRLQCQELWKGLSPEDKSRFDRHVRPIWDRLRHRSPPHLHARVIRDIEKGTLCLEHGRVTATRHGLNGWTVDTEQMNGKLRHGPFDLVFDCSGPGTQSVHPLAAPLIAEGHALRHPHGGLAVLPSGAVLGANGNATTGLFALGPLGAGSLLEITAAPEIVAQTEALVKSISSFDRNRPASATVSRKSLDASCSVTAKPPRSSPVEFQTPRTRSRG